MDKTIDKGKERDREIKRERGGERENKRERENATKIKNKDFLKIFLINSMCNFSYNMFEKIVNII